MMRRSGRKMRRGAHWAVVAISVAASLLLAACSSSGSGGSGGSTGLTWFFWTGSPGETTVWQHNAGLVSKTYPNINVSLTTTSFSDFWSKLPLEASTHSMPCLAGLQYGYVGADANLFTPLNSFISKNHYSLSPFDTSMIKELSDNGKLLALPYDFGPVYLVYNKALFKAKGVPEPTDGWTYSQFLQDAKKLTGGGDYGYGGDYGTGTGLGLSLELAYDLTGTPNAYVQNGTFNLTNSAFEKGIQDQAALTYQDHVTPPSSAAANYSTQVFDSGKVGMEVAGPWDLIDVKDASNFPIGWVEFPAGPNGMRTYNEGSGFGITKDCKTPDAAFKALSVLVGSQALSYAGSNGRAYPARLADDPKWSTYAGGNAGPVTAAAVNGAPEQEVTTNWTAFQDALGKYAPLVQSGQLSAAQFAKQVQAAAGPGKGVVPGDLSSLLGG
jgi:multiple sugar transport system substrate-binding protein